MKKIKKMSRAVCCGALSLAFLASYTAVNSYMNNDSDIIQIKADGKIKGDVDNNGVISSADMLKIRQYMLGKATLDEQGLLNADMNDDNRINVVDCIMLIGTLMDDGGQPAVTTVTPAVTTKPDVTDPGTAKEDEKTIKLNGSSISVTGTGMTANAGTVTIKEPGTYVITGKLDNGQIIVDVDKTAYPEGQVELSLQGADITCTNNSPVYIASIADECTISVKKGTTNTISDGKDYKNADEDTGAIYSKDDLKIKGKGTLVVNGNCADGIVGKDSVKIFNGTVNVAAVDDGIRGKDSVKIGDAEDTEFADLKVTVKTTLGDGIKTTNDTDADKGNIILNGGTLKVTSYGDAISAENTVKVNGGDIDLYTYTGSGTQNTQPTQPTQGGRWPGQEGNTTKSDISAKGIKGIKGIEINGGNITVDSTDDAIHGNADTTINGGSMTLASGDDGIHSDNILTVNDGTINITKSYEGIEAYDIEIKGGNIKLVASDDGFNAAGGDGSATENQNPWGQGRMFSSSIGVLNISGGYMYVEANGDGVDSNGNLTVSGGTVIVCGPTRGGNGIFDIGDGGNYSFKFTGGTVIGIGTSDMFVSPTASNGFLKGTSITFKTGNMITVADADGNVLSALKVPASLNMTGAAVYASAKLDTNKYSIYTGGTYDGELDANGYGEGGKITGATVAGKAGTAGGEQGGFPTRPGR